MNNPDPTYRPAPQRPRIVIDLTQEQKDRLTQLLPWGIQNELYRVITNDLITLLENHGPLALGLLLQREVKLTDYCKPLQELGKKSEVS